MGVLGTSDVLPLYLTVEQAAEYAGVGVKRMREWVNSADPPPYLLVGRERHVETAALPRYLERKQEVRLCDARL